jgi:hypothetical protein
VPAFHNRSLTFEERNNDAAFQPFLRKNHIGEDYLVENAIGDFFYKIFIGGGDLLNISNDILYGEFLD